MSTPAWPGVRGRFWRSILRGAGVVARRLAHALAAHRRLAALDGGAQHFAAQRSRELLLACLTPAQRREFERTRGFTVHGQSGRRYRIGFGSVANIDVLGDHGELLYRLCAKPDDLPTPAVMLAQKLMLETRESDFLRIAARHPLLVSMHGLQGATNPF